jgi:proline iminopeptidase
MHSNMRPRTVLSLVLVVSLSCAAIFGTNAVQAGSVDVIAGRRTMNGTDLYCRSQGVGETIVVLHGGPGVPHDYFLPHLEPLADHHQVIFYDQRATGRSSADVDPATITMETFIADLDALRESFGLEAMHLLGHSWGGLLAMQYAVRYPQHVESLILVDSAPANSTLDEQSMAIREERLTDEDRQAMAAVMQTEDFAAGDPTAIMEYLRIAEKVRFYNPDRMADLQMELDRSTIGKLMLVSGAMRDYLADYDIHDQLDAINCPTLIIHGSFDPIPLESSQRIHQQIAGSILTVMEQCGHFPFVENRDGFMELINRFLDNEGCDIQRAE